MSGADENDDQHGHGHGHGHGHDHEHPSGDAENPWAGQGAVMLDIGGDIGALVVDMPAALVGLEVEIRPQGDTRPPGDHPHVAVVARPVGTLSVPSLVYPDLVAGTYELYEKGTGNVEMTVQVNGGQVTEATWPSGS
jgi:hypothetical protein